MTDPAPYPPVDGTQPCRNDPEAFFPDKKVESDTSKASGPGSPSWNGLAPGTREGYWAVQYAADLCAGCPFRRPCLAYALTTDVVGIWGGTTHLERRHLRAEHGITARPVSYVDPTARGAEIVRLLTGGVSVADVAQVFGISTQAVHDHKKRHAAQQGATA